MCGIYGYASLHDQASTVSREAMGDSLRHRGPDESGFLDAGFALVGNQRLAVIDVEHGKQPFVSECGNVAVVQNGEIYNYRELGSEVVARGADLRTGSDTEVLLHLYLQYGADFVQKLNGMFAIAIIDKRSRSLFLFRDRVGVKPLFVAEHEGQLLFASEIKALLAAGLPAKIDQTALDLYLSFNFVPPPYTAVYGVTHLEPGSMLEVRAGSVEKKRWWNLADYGVETGQTIDSAASNVLDLLQDAVALRMRCDVPYGAFLSGGIDSSTVVGLMSRLRQDPIATYSIGFDDERFDESPFAQEASSRFGTRNNLRKLQPDCFESWPEAIYYCDQPHGDVSFVPTLKLSELAAPEVKVVLTGDGGDELFAGYDKYLRLFESRSAGGKTQSFEEDLLSSLTLFGRELKENLLGRQATGVSEAMALDYIASLTSQVPEFDEINKALFVDCRMLLPGNNLVKPDRMAMSRSLEARTPFLDYRMVQLAFSMPGDFKLRNAETKHVLKKAVSGLIGENLTYRRKQMFTVPVGEWFKSHLQQYMRDVLGCDGLAGRGLFRPEAIGKMMDEHTEGSANRTRELRALMALEIWIREIIEGEAIREPWWTPDLQRDAVTGIVKTG